MKEPISYQRTELECLIEMSKKNPHLFEMVMEEIEYHDLSGNPITGLKALINVKNRLQHEWVERMLDGRTE